MQNATGEAPTLIPVVKCTNKGHEHLSEVDQDGNHLLRLIPMVCSHCKRPAHYEYPIEDYRHDDGADCFLISGTASPCN